MDCGYDYRTVLTALKVGLAALAFGFAAGASADESQQKQKELDRLRERIGTLSKKLDNDRQKQDRLTGEIESAEQRIAAATEQLTTLRRDIQSQNGQLEKTNSELGRVNQALASQKRALAGQLRAAYAIGERSQTKLMLNLDNAARLTRLLTYFDALNRGRAERIGRVRQQVESVRTLQLRQQQERSQLQALLTRREAAVAGLKAGRERRSALLTQLAARIADASAELQLLQAGERELLSLLDSLKDALSDIPFDLGKSLPFAKLRGQMSWPVKGKLLAKFGQPKAGGRLKWNGLWIGSAEGSAVKAVARGRVAYVGWMHRYGLIVVLEHDGNFYSLYGHNQSVKISAGEWVEAGQVITTVGNTGGHERAGLYFELRKASISVDPADWLKK